MTDAEEALMRLVQVALGAEDLDRAADFYTVLLESAPTARFDDVGLVFFDLDGVRLLLDRNAPSALLWSRSRAAEPPFEARSRADRHSEEDTLVHVQVARASHRRGVGGVAWSS